MEYLPATVKRKCEAIVSFSMLDMVFKDTDSEATNVRKSGKIPGTLWSGVPLAYFGVYRYRKEAGSEI
jgi:hypothetical protein